jgi:hypothetical protein
MQALAAELADGARDAVSVDQPATKEIPARPGRPPGR